MPLPLRLLRGAVGSGSAWTPAALFPANAGAWFDARDSSLMAVNADGSGGVPAVGAGVGRLQDKSGNGLHLSFVTQRPYRRSDHIAFPNEIGASRARMRNTTGITGATTQSMTGMIVMETMGMLDGQQWPFDWNVNTSGGRFGLNGGVGSPGSLFYTFFLAGSLVVSPLKWNTRKVCITWRGSASAFEAWINGVQWTRAAVTSQALDGFMFGAGAGGYPTKTRLREAVLIGAALSDPDFLALRNYGEAAAGISSITQDIILAYGDSLTAGTGSVTARSWVDQLTVLPNARQLNLGREGAFSYAGNPTTASILSAYPPGAGKNIACVWFGANDLAVPRTGLQIYNDVSAICSALRAGGYKVIVATLPARTGINNTELADANTRLRAGYTGFADGIADLAARSELSNTADTTYYTSDGVHFLDAGYAVIASVFDAAITPLL